MKVSREEFKESMKYFEEIADDNFYKKLNIEFDELYSQYKNIKESKSLTKEDKNNKLLEIRKQANARLAVYDKINLNKHTATVIAYKKGISFEEAAKIEFLPAGENEELHDTDFDILKKAIYNINSLCISPTMLSMILGVSRQYINLATKQKKIISPIIGHATAFRLTDIL